MPVVVDAPDLTRTESTDEERDGDETAAPEEPEEDQGPLALADGPPTLSRSAV